MWIFWTKILGTRKSRVAGCSWWGWRHSTHSQTLQRCRDIWGKTVRISCLCACLQGKFASVIKLLYLHRYSSSYGHSAFRRSARAGGLCQCNHGNVLPYKHGEAICQLLCAGWLPSEMLRTALLRVKEMPSCTRAIGRTRVPINALKIHVWSHKSNHFPKYKLQLPVKTYRSFLLHVNSTKSWV